jgi:transposase InsO family protein
MVASDGLRGTLRQPANPSEGWRTATDRKNRRNQVDIERKISNLVEQAFREANCARNRVPEVAPLDPVHEVTNRSQTTGNFKKEKLVSENEPRKKRWRRMRSSWRPLSSFPNREERKLLNKNINTMSKWDFECALAEFKRNEQKLEDITGQLEYTLAAVEEQANQAECYLKMQGKLQKILFNEEIKRLPSHYHSAAACVYTNHATRYKLSEDQHNRRPENRRNVDEFLAQIQDLKARNKSFISKSKTYLLSAREYYRWWKGYLTKTPMEAETHANATEQKRFKPNLKNHEAKKVNKQRFSRDLPAHSLRKTKLTRMDKMCDEEFNFNGDGYGVARATEPDTFGIRFKQCNLPRQAKRGKCRNPSNNSDFGWKDEEWSREYYDALEDVHNKEQLDMHYEEFDNCEFQYDRIATARMATSLTGSTPLQLANNIFRSLVSDFRGEDNGSEPSEVDDGEQDDDAEERNNDTENEPMATPANAGVSLQMNEALATFIKETYPDALLNFSASDPEVMTAIRNEAKRILQDGLKTPRDQPTTVPALDSMTKLMLSSYSSLDEVGQNQVWLAACHSNNKDLLKGIITLRQTSDNSSSKLAKLVKELLTHSEKAKIEQLKWHTQAQQRRTNFHHWIARIKDVCAMFKETSNIMPKEVIIPFADKKCIGNRAIYQLILSKVDNHCRDLLRHCNEEGDTALTLLFVKCANVSGVDTDHYHQLFVGLRAFQDESATRFIDRFLIARTSAERAQNEYSNSKLVSFLLTGLSSHKNPSYQLLISIIREKQMSGTETAYEDLERRFLAIDETAARDNYANRRLTSARAVRSDRRQKGKGKGNARANAVQSSSGGGRDLSKLKCYNCQEFGHYARDCPKPQRHKNNETSTASGSSLKRGKSTSSHAAAAAGGTSTGNSSSTDSTPGTTATPSTRAASRVSWANSADARANVASSLRSYGCSARRVLWTDELTYPYDNDRNCQYDTSCEDGALDDSYYSIYSLKILEDYFTSTEEQMLRVDQSYFGENPVTRYKSLCLLHHQLPDYIEVIRPNGHNATGTPRSRARIIIINGILPAFYKIFDQDPKLFPTVFKVWLAYVNLALERRLSRDNNPNRVVVVTCDEYNINVTFCASSSAMHRASLMTKLNFDCNEDESPTQAYDSESDDDSCPSLCSRTDSDSDSGWESDDSEWMLDDEELVVNASAFHTKLTYVQALAGRRVEDPTAAEIGEPRDLRNFVADSGATDDMTPRRADLFDTVEDQNLGVEVADGHIIKCSVTGKINVDMLDDEGKRVQAVLDNVMYVPGLTQRLFSITNFVNNGNKASFERNALKLYFGDRSVPVTIQMMNGRVSAMPAKKNSEANQANDKSLPRKSKPKKRVRTELLHKRLGHRYTTTILAASEHEVWADVEAQLTPDVDCVDCKIATIRASDRNKHPHTPSERFGQMVLMDIEHAIAGGSITPDSSLPFYLFIVDAYSRYCKIYGLRHKTTNEVVSAIQKFVADHGLINQFGYIDVDRLRADAGSQFTSKSFGKFCQSERINLSLAAPKRLSQNHMAERTWQTVTGMARSMLVHARLPDTYYYHALRYATAVFNVLPVKGVYTKDGVIGTPYELCRGHKPAILEFKVFGCPCVAKKYLAAIDGSTQSKQTERGIRGVFIGFPENQKGYLLYVPSTRSICVSGDVFFDENFSSAIARTWQQFHDGLALIPKKSYIPPVDTFLSHTGCVEDNFQPVEEGELQEGADVCPSSVTHFDDDDESMPCLSHCSSHSSDEEDEDDANQYTWEADFEDIENDGDYNNIPPADPVSVGPQVVDNSAIGSQRPKRETRAPTRLTMDHREAAGKWKETRFCKDVELAAAFNAEVITPTIDASGSDASIFEPAPDNLRVIMKMKNSKIKEAWLKAYYKELKVLISSGTFSIENMLEGEVAVPTMETNRVKLQSDGTLDKLKTRIVVRGDLQNKQSIEDKWSPTASFRSLKMFLAHAARLKVRVRQMDFIGAFLQAKVRSRVFIKMPAVYGELFPDLKAYCGVPVRLIKSMYGMSLSGKYWYQELQEFLLENGFLQSKVIACLFWKVFPDGSSLCLLDYVDDCLYFGTNDASLKQFEMEISARFDLTLMGQAHWYLSTRITQSANFNITLDQSRYCLSIIRRYLDTVGCANVSREHTTPLPLEFVPTADDNSVDEAAAEALSNEFNLDVASCVGALIYLALTRVDISHAVNKMAKYTRRPGKNHFMALVHVLRYLRDNSHVGITFYSDLERSPIHNLLLKSASTAELGKEMFFTFSDSSWNDDVDTGRSTGCYLIVYMGGIVDHSSNMPSPVALSSAEAEYNEACLACMGTNHMSMLLDEIEGNEQPRQQIPLILDSKSAIAMGNSFRDTKHTRHILRRFHYVREEVDSGRFRLFWIKTDDELADIGTKQTPGPRHTLLTNTILVRVSDGLKSIKAAFAKLVKYKRGDSV